MPVEIPCVLRAYPSTEQTLLHKSICTALVQDFKKEGVKGQVRDPMVADHPYQSMENARPLAQLLSRKTEN